MIVVFDGMCNVCNGYIRFLSARDRQRRLSFVTASSDLGRQLLKAADISPDDPWTMLVVDGDRRLIRSDAVIAGVRSLGGGWRAASLVAIMPRRLRDALYAGFAARRYRWFGRACDCAACDAGSGVRARR